MKINSVTFTAPELTPHTNGVFKLTKSLTVTVNFVGGKFDRYYIPQGFLTDFGSVPLAFQPIIPKFGDWGISVAYFVHDFNYTTHEHSREYADDLLYFMLLDAGMSKWKALAVLAAVRVFGKSAWKKGYDPAIKNMEAT